MQVYSPFRPKRRHLFQETEVDMKKIMPWIFGNRPDREHLIRFQSDSSITELEEGERDCLSEASEKNYDDNDSSTPIEESTTKRLFLNDDPVNESSAEKYFNINVGGLNSEKVTPICNFENSAWGLLLRSRCTSSKFKRKKIWRPIVIKLEKASLQFHAQGFETSPPFKVIPLMWCHLFNPPKYQGSCGEHTMLTTSLLSASLGSNQHRLFLKSPTLRGKTGLRLAKVGCLEHKVLLDFMETVQRCIFTFPGFRPRGIRYRKDRVFVDIEGVYDVVQIGKNEIKAISEVRVRVKALVSGSPECRIVLNGAGSFDRQGQAEVREVSFHKCVQDKDLRSPLVVTFIPLDNCWFQLINLNSIIHKPPPLRGEVTVTVHHRNWFELQAQIFRATPSSASLDKVHVRNINLRFNVPLLLLQYPNTSQAEVGKNTRVSNGKVVYSLSTETMTWSIRRLPLKTHENYTRTQKPLASLNSNFNPASSLDSGLVTKTPVEMDFVMGGNTVASGTDISGMYLGHKNFDSYKTQYSSRFRVVIPVDVLSI